MFGAAFLGVEQHEVAACGAFDPDGKGQIVIVILAAGGSSPSPGGPPSTKSVGKRPMPSASAEPHMGQAVRPARMESPGRTSVTGHASWRTGF